MTAGAREVNNFSPQYYDDEHSQRLVSPSRYHGVIAADQAIHPEECSERIDRLLQRVQQTHREYTAWQALGSPETPTPTRFDAQTSMGTVSTVSLASSSHSDAGDGDMYSQRSAMDAPKPDGMRPGTRSSTDVRQKLDRLRAKRRAEQSQVAATRHVSGGDFFENSYNVSMFQELSAPVKELEWDKRVYYYHLAQNNDAYRRISEDVDVKDCRSECLNELGGSSSRRRRDEIDAVSAWLEDPDDGEDIGERSFDWSRDGFGYMEFRRLSRASINSVLSPGGLATRTPLSLLDPHVPVTPRAMVEGTPSPQRALFPPPANSAGRMGSLRRISLGQRAAQRPVSIHTDFKQPLSRISEGGPDDDGESMAVDHEYVDDTPAARAQLRNVTRENRQLLEEIKMARNAIDALTRLVLESA